MSEDTEATTVEETEADQRQKHQEEQMGNLVTTLMQRAEDAAEEKMTKLIGALTGQKTAEQRNTEDALETVTTPQRAPARSAGRTNPAALADFRYRKLPDSQRKFRTPDNDYQVSRFFRALVTKDQTTLRAIAVEDRHDRAALIEGDVGASFAPFDGTGGQLVPLPLENYMLNAFYDAGRMRQEARIIQSTDGASVRISMQDLASTSTWEGENEAIQGVEPTASAAINLRLKKHGNLSTLSNEILADVFGVATWLVTDVANQMAESEDIKLYRDGDALKEPDGFEGAVTIVAAEASNPDYFIRAAGQTAIAEDDPGSLDLNLLQRMFYALPEKERANAIWTGPSSIAQLLSSLEDTQGRQILRQQNQEAGVVGDAIGSATTTTILGKRFVEMPGLEGTGQDSNRLYFSNMQRTYVMLVRGGFNVASTTEGGSAFANDTTVFRFTQRLDGGTFLNPIPTRPQFVFCANIQTIT